MRIAQLFLMAVIFVLLWFALHHRSSTEARAFRRIAFLGLTVLIILAVIFPDTLTGIANTFGIGRGDRRQDRLLLGGPARVRLHAGCRRRALLTG